MSGTNIVCTIVCINMRWPYSSGNKVIQANNEGFRCYKLKINCFNLEADEDTYLIFNDGGFPWIATLQLEGASKVCFNTGEGCS